MTVHIDQQVTPEQAMVRAELCAEMAREFGARAATGDNRDACLQAARMSHQLADWWATHHRHLTQGAQS
jgi:predicted HAD superfamily Cof-like phosphohydrolase